MGEIGSGSGTSYPSVLDTNNSLEVNQPDTNKTLARAEVPNDLAACIIAIETELGLNPKGSAADVKTFLQVEHNTDGTHDTSTVVKLSDIQTLTNKTLTSPALTSPALTSPVISSGLTLQGSAWPSFSVHRNGVNQNVSNITNTKVQWTTEVYDTNSDFDPAANYRFTPTVAGTYLFNTAIEMTSMGSAEHFFIIALYKNGTEYQRLLTHSSAQASNQAFGAVFQVQANGSTDYFEIYVYQDSGATRTIDGTAAKTFWSGTRIA